MFFWKALSDLRTLPAPALWRPGMLIACLLAVAAGLCYVPAFARHRALSEPFWWIFCAGMLTAYFRGYALLRNSPSAGAQRPVIVACAVLFCILGLMLPPFHDIDHSGYINIGWQQAGYGLNPYVSTLADTPGWNTDPMFRSSCWDQTPCAYGFLFARIADGVCRLGNGDWHMTLFLFRALGVLVFLAGGWVVWTGCKLLKLPHPERALYLLLWNPLLLMMTVVQVHNDLWMALFTSLSLSCAIAGSWLLVMPLLALAVLLKHFSAVVVPFAFLFLWRRHGAKKAVLSSFVALVVGLAVSWPYVSDLRVFQLGKQMENAGELHNSLIAMLYFPFEVLRKPFPWVEALAPGYLATVRLVCLCGFLALAGCLGWRRLRAAEYRPAELIRDAVLLHFTLICLASSKFYAWYLGMFLPLALWLPAGDWLRRTVLAISCAQLLSLTFIDQSHFVNVLVMLVLPAAWAISSRPALPLWLHRLAGGVGLAPGK